MEGSKGNALLLEHISKSPIGIGFIILSQSGKLLCQKCRVLIGVMNRCVGNIGGIILCNMNLQSPILRIAVNDFAGCVQIGKAILCLLQLRISVMSYTLRRLYCIIVPGDKINRNPILVAILHKSLNPDFIGAAADSRSSHTKPPIYLLDCIKGGMKQFKIFLHIRIFPKTARLGSFQTSIGQVTTSSLPYLLLRCSIRALIRLLHPS